jgi:hypothetical protein
LRRGACSSDADRAMAWRRYALQVAAKLVDQGEETGDEGFARAFLACSPEASVYALLDRTLALPESAWERRFCLQVLVTMASFCVLHKGFPHGPGVGARLVSSLAGLVAGGCGDGELAASALGVIEQWPLTDVEPLFPKAGRGARCGGRAGRRGLTTVRRSGGRFGGRARCGAARQAAAGAGTAGQGRAGKGGGARGEHRDAAAGVRHVLRRVLHSGAQKFAAPRADAAPRQVSELVQSNDAAPYTPKLADAVYTRLVSYEYSGDSEDPALAGLLDLAAAVRPLEAARDWDLADALLGRYLLAVPTLDDAHRRAVASSASTRRRCFGVLSELVRRRGADMRKRVMRELEVFCQAAAVPVKQGGKVRARRCRHSPPPPLAPRSPILHTAPKSLARCPPSSA